MQAREPPEKFLARFGAFNRVLPRLGAVNRGSSFAEATEDRQDRVLKLGGLRSGLGTPFQKRLQSNIRAFWAVFQRKPQEQKVTKKVSVTFLEGTARYRFTIEAQSARRQEPKVRGPRSEIKGPRSFRPASNISMSVVVCAFLLRFRFHFSERNSGRSLRVAALNRARIYTPGFWRRMRTRDRIAPGCVWLRVVAPGCAWLRIIFVKKIFDEFLEPQRNTRRKRKPGMDANLILDEMTE